MYLAPQNIPRAISVLTLGNKVVLRERDTERERERERGGGGGN